MGLRGLHQLTVLVQHTVLTATVIRGLHQLTVLVQPTVTTVRNILITAVNKRYLKISKIRVLAAALIPAPSEFLYRQLAR